MPAEQKRRQTAHPYRQPRTPSDPSSSKSNRPRPTHKIPTTEVRDNSGIPGLSKLKSSIRQTRRLLSKDNLDPALRIQTQRRLTSLESDLAAAQRRNIERTNGARYHKVKFFERQKLLRIIKRLKKKLSDSTDKKTLSDEKRFKYDEELEDARVMLNYVLHYPNTQKYIALFPSSSLTQPDTENKEDKLRLPPLLHPPPSSLDGPFQRRYDLLLETKQLMDKGKLKGEPENEMKKGIEDGVVVGLGADVQIGLTESTAQKDQPQDDFFESGDK
ncbi:hypothetical protein L204_105803 [Cryptococcus depauperatus]|nr:rRNA-processing protein EFG1 [Cryptococcus depauperatus CBS 7855]